MKDGKKVPFFAADGKGKMQSGGVMDTKLRDVPAKAKVAKKVVRVKNATVGDVVLGPVGNTIRKKVGKAIKNRRWIKKSTPELKNEKGRNDGR